MFDKKKGSDNYSIFIVLIVGIVGLFVVGNFDGPSVVSDDYASDDYTGDVVSDSSVTGNFVAGTAKKLKRGINMQIAAVRPRAPVQNAPAVVVDRGVQAAQGVVDRNVPAMPVSIGTRCQSDAVCGDLICERPGGIPQGVCKVRQGRQCTGNADCTMGYECINRVCVLPPPEVHGESRDVYPLLVHVNSVIDGQDVNQRATVASQFFMHNNLFPGFFRQVPVTSVLALPYDGNLATKLGGAWCYDHGGVAGEGGSQWCVVTSRNAKKTFNRFAAFKFGDGQYNSRGKASTLGGVLELRRAEGSARGSVGVHVFMRETAGSGLKWLTYCEMGNNDARKTCRFLLDGKRPEEIVVARAKWTGGVVPYVHDLHVEVELAVPLHEQDGVLVLNNVGGRWVPGQTLGDVLGDDEVAVIGVKGPDGKVRNFAISQQDVACVSDGSEGKDMKEWARGQREDVVAGVAEKIGDVLGKDFGDKVGSLITGNPDAQLQEDLKKVKMCDDSAKCKMMKDNGLLNDDGTPAGYEAPRNRLGGNEWAMDGGGTETAEERFKRQEKDSEYGTPEKTTTVDVMRGSDPSEGVSRMEVTEFPNGAARVDTTPMTFQGIQGSPADPVTGERQGIFVQDGPTRSEYVHPDDKSKQAELEQVKELKSHEVNWNVKGETSAIDLGSGQPMAIVYSARVPLVNPNTNCAPDDDKCYNLPPEMLKGLAKIAPELVAHFLEHGKITPEQARAARFEQVGRPADDPEGVPNRRVPQTPEQQCLFQHSERVPEINPGNLGDIYPPTCNFNCPPEQLAVGLSCEQEAENQQRLPNPMATCAGNLVNRDAIRCPENNPNCGRNGGGRGGAGGGGGPGEGGKGGGGKGGGEGGAGGDGGEGGGNY